MRKAQAALGFNFPPALSTTSRIAKVTEVSDLLEGLESIRNRYIGYTARQIRTFPEIRESSDELLHALGSKLWPDRKEGEEIPDWLLSAPDNPGDHHPDRLYYSDPNDRGV